MNLRRLPCLLLLACTVAARAQELPVKAPGEIIEGLPDLNAMDRPPPPGSTGKAGEALSVAEASARLERARRKQARWEKLARQGVLSQAEAEQCVLEVGQALVRYEHVRVAEAQAECDALQARKAEPALTAAALSALTASQGVAAGADAQFLQTRLRLARVNLDRYQRLFAEKLIGRNQVERARSALAALQAQAAK